jgi:hypothetical protein
MTISLEGNLTNDDMTRTELQTLFETVELRLLTAMRDDPAAVPSLQLQNNLLWSLLNPEHFEE